MSDREGASDSESEKEKEKEIFSTIEMMRHCQEAKLVWFLMRSLLLFEVILLTFCIIPSVRLVAIKKTF